jgi:hypothetical protein
MKKYDCPKSLTSYLWSDKFINLVVGPVGSTKTTTSIIKILTEASRVAPCQDGIRRSRTAWIRNTSEQLTDTSIPDFLSWFPEGDACEYHRTGKRAILKIGDVEAEILFRGLDDSNDVRRLLSLQLSFGVMDEFREIHQDIFEALQGRIGRYPNKSMNGVGCCTTEGQPLHKIWGASNPPDMETKWEQFLTSPPDNANVFFQPSGVSPEADWLQYLPADYYANLMESHNEEWNNIYVHAKFGSSLAGKPVFRCFNRETHVAKEELVPLPSSLIIGVDAGLNPTAVITQTTYDGRLLALDAITGNTEGMGALRFIREKLRPLLTNKYPTARVLVVIDPAAFQRAQTDERSVADIFRSEGFTVKPAKTNSIAARIAAGEKYLTKTVDGKAGLLVCPKNSSLLTKALAGMYRYKTNTKGETDSKPDKNHPWSDIADAFTYACLHADGGGLFGSTQNRQLREVERVSSGGWT